MTHLKKLKQHKRKIGRIAYMWVDAKRSENERL